MPTIEEILGIRPKRRVREGVVPPEAPIREPFIREAPIREAFREAPEEMWRPREPVPERPRWAMPEEKPPVADWELLKREVAPTPWYRTVAEKAAAPFEWVKEHLEEPWAAAITTPFRPVGVTYEEWKAPKFIKGLAELSMPLWWLPYFGWMAKGAGVIPKIGGSLAKGVVAAEKAIAFPIAKPLEMMGTGIVKIAKMPAFAKMRADVLKADTFRALANKLSVLPGFKTAAGIVNPAALAHTEAEIGRAVHGGLREVAENAANMAMLNVERHGTTPQIAQLFGFDDMMRTTKVAAKAGYKPVPYGEVAPKEIAPLNWWDIASNPKAYNLTPAQEGFIKDYQAVVDGLTLHAKEMGVKIPKMEGTYIPRAWKGRLGVLDTETGIWRPVGTAYEPGKWEQILTVPLRTKLPSGRIGGKAWFEYPREYVEFAEDALRAGLRPEGWGPMETLHAYARGVYRRISDRTVAEVLNPLGKVLKEFVKPGIRERSAEAALQYRALRKMSEIIPRAKRGEAIPTPTLKSLEARTGEYVSRIKDIVKLPVSERAKGLTALRKEVIGARKAAYSEWMMARSIRTREMAGLRAGVPGWEAVGHPFAAGKLFPTEIARDLNKMLADRGMPIITKLSNVNALSRFLVTGFDFGAGLIQGVPLLMSNPFKWGRAMGISMQAFVDPAVRARIMARPENIAALEKLIPEGLLIGSSEFMEAAGRGLLRSQPVQVIDKLNTIQRFATSFNTFGDLARIEWAKGLLPMVEREGRSLKELAAFLNEATGVMSTRALGIGATQREIEGAIFLFAPRYFRANFSLWADMMRGGLRGELARDTLTSMIMGGFFWYYGACKALGQEPNLNPSSGKFMTVQVGNQHIGLGSMQVAMLRLFGNIYRTATEDPEGFIKLDSRDNPLLRFARSRVAPVTGASWDMLTGKTFIGEPLDTIPSFTKNVFADRLLPFWLASYISDDPKPEWFAGLGEVAGLRTWPLQLWERQNELRERLAQAEYGKPWYPTKTENGINELQKKQLESKYDELRRATEATRAQRLERAGAKEQMWFAFQDDRKRARFVYDNKLKAAQQRFDAGQIVGYDFKELAKAAGAGLRGAYRNIETNPAYTEVMEFLAQPMTEEEMRDTPIEDMAFDVYMSFMYSGDLEDASGEYDFAEADRRRQIFIAQYGEGMYDYVINRLAEGRDVPPLMQEYYNSQEVLRPYWRIRDDIVAIRGEPKTKYAEARINSIVGRLRKRWLRDNPEGERYYDLFHRRKPKYLRTT